MSLYFQANSDAQQQRVLESQLREVNQQRIAAEASNGTMSELLRRTLGLKTNSGAEKYFDDQLMSVNSGLTPADAYREMDKVSEIVRNPIGEFATLGRVMGFSKSVDIGKQVLEYRKVSGLSNGAKTSMSGQTGVNIDHTSVSYAGTIVPIHDYGFGRGFREIAAMRADGYDALVDDAREADLVIRRKLVDYLWNGSSLELKGNTWGGIKGDANVVQSTFTLDLLDPSTQPLDIYNLIKQNRDTLRIANNLGMEMDLVVSREFFSVMEQPFTLQQTGFGKLMDMLKSIDGIREIYADPQLTSNEFALLHIGFEGLSAVTGMALSTVAVPRQIYNDDFQFIKACATGFLARSDYNDNKACLYAQKV